MAAILATVITGATLLFPGLNRSDALGFFYFPAILLSVIFSGGSHSPSAAAGWSSFVAYTLLYWGVFLIVYALLWQYYLLRKASPHLDSANNALKLARLQNLESPNFDNCLQAFGLAVEEVENSRRRHLLLKNVDSLNLSQPKHLLAAQAITEFGNERWVKGLVKRFRSKLAGQIGSPETASLIMKEMIDYARTLDAERKGAASESSSTQ